MTKLSIHEADSIWQSLGGFNHDCRRGDSHPLKQRRTGFYLHWIFMWLGWIFISHKKGISLMLLGLLLAVQTLMAHGLSSGKLSTVSQLRFIFEDEVVSADTWPLSSVNWAQGLLLNCASKKHKLLWVGKKQKGGHGGLVSVQKLWSRETGFITAEIIVCTCIAACWG